MPHDVVFRGALVLDGTGAPAFPADVAVEGGRITVIGSVTGSTREEIAADGLVLSPGFIDVHTHDDFALRTSPDMAFKTLQGVTTVVTGNCGTSAVPFVEWIDGVRARPAAVNVAALIGHGSVRESVMGRSEARAATDSEMTRMRDMVAEAMDAGAVGMSTGLVYEPGRYSPTEEVVELAVTVGARGGIYTTHMRNERDGLVNSIEETLHVGRLAGVKLQVSHLKAIGAENFALAGQAVGMIKEARRAGIDVMADQYPYTRGSTALGQLVSAGAFDGPSPFGFVEAQDVLVASAPLHPEWEGLTLDNVAASLGLDGPAAARHLVREEGNLCMIIYANQSEANVEMIMREEFVMIGSDGVPAGSNPHPRLHHTFPRVLGEYCRDRGIIDLPTAVHKMTGMASARFGLADRGTITTGSFADLVLFDPSSVRDTGTYEHPTSAPIGFFGTWVNGQQVATGTSSTAARAGAVLTL